MADDRYIIEQNAKKNIIWRRSKNSIYIYVSITNYHQQDTIQCHLMQLILFIAISSTRHNPVKFKTCHSTVHSFYRNIIIECIQSYNSNCFAFFIAIITPFALIISTVCQCFIKCFERSFEKTSVGTFIDIIFNKSLLLLILVLICYS